MTTITITPSADNRIAVRCPYNASFVQAARTMAGKWDGAAWVFPSETMPQVRDLLVRVYGQDDRPPAETVRLRVKYDSSLDTGGHGEVVIGGRQLVRGFGRDSGARMGEDVVLVAGKVSSGGSRKNWRVTVSEGATFDLLRLPRPMADRLVVEAPENCRIVNQDGSEIAAAVPAEGTVVAFPTGGSR